MASNADLQSGTFSPYDNAGQYPLESEVSRLTLGTQPIVVQLDTTGGVVVDRTFPPGTTYEQWNPPGQDQPLVDPRYVGQCVDGTCVDQNYVDPNYVDETYVEDGGVENFEPRFADPKTLAQMYANQFANQNEQFGPSMQNPRFYLTAQRNIPGFVPGMSPQSIYQPGRVSPQQAIAYELIKLVTGGGGCPPQQYDPRFPQTYDPRFPQTYDPRFPQTYDPRFPQTYDPRFPQTYDPRFPQTYDPRFPQTYDPRFPQTYDPRFPQTYDPRFPQPYNPNSPFNPGCLPRDTTGQLITFLLPWALRQLNQGNHHRNFPGGYSNFPGQRGGYRPTIPGGCQSMNMNRYMPGFNQGIGFNIGGARINFGSMGRNFSSMGRNYRPGGGRHHCR